MTQFQGGCCDHRSTPWVAGFTDKDTWSLGKLGVPSVHQNPPLYSDICCSNSGRYIDGVLGHVSNMCNLYAYGHVCVSQLLDGPSYVCVGSCCC